MRTSSLAILTLACLPLAACASAWKPPEIAYDDTPHRLALEPDLLKPVKVVEIPRPLPLPGQLKPLPGARGIRPSLQIRAPASIKRTACEWRSNSPHL